MMRKILTGASFILVLSLTFNACAGSETNNEKAQTDQVTADTTAKNSKQLTATYQCPMKCEGEKTYAAAGACPECEMDLAKVE